MPLTGQLGTALSMPGNLMPGGPTPLRTTPPQYPSLRFEVNLDDDPSIEFPPTGYTDLSFRVRGFSTRRGRNNFVDRVEGGVASVLLDNRDGYLNFGQPGRLLLRRARLRAFYDQTYFPLFTGHIESYRYSYPGVDHDAVVELTLSDGLKVLGLQQLPASYVREAESADLRVGSVLETAGIGATYRNVPATYVDPDPLAPVRVTPATDAVTFTLAATLVDGSATITVASTTGLASGMGVSGTGVPAGAVVDTVTDGTHFTIRNDQDPAYGKAFLSRLKDTTYPGYVGPWYEITGISDTKDLTVGMHVGPYYNSDGALLFDHTVTEVQSDRVIVSTPINHTWRGPGDPGGVATHVPFTAGTSQTLTVEKSYLPVTGSLEHVRQVEATERGLFVLKADGTYEYQGSGYRPAQTAQLTFGEIRGVPLAQQPATTLFDFAENPQGGAFSGWGVQTTTGASVVGDSTVLIPGLKTTKHTVVDSLGTVDRADTVYNNQDYVSPAGSLGMAPGSSSWWRHAIKLDANYVPQGGAQPRFNVMADWHGTVTVYTPLAIAINQTTGKWCVEINGGGSDPNNPEPGGSRFYDLFPYVLGAVVDFKVFVKLAGDSTGRTIVRASVNGGAYTTYVDESGPIGCSTETSWYLKTAHYRRGNLGGGTTTVYHSGWIRGDTESDLVVPTAGTNKVGYLAAGVPVIGGTVNTNTVGKRGSGPFPMPEDGALTHLASYMDFTGTGAIESLLVVYADIAGAPGAKLGQTRLISFDPATEPSGFKEIPLAHSVPRQAGSKFHILQYFGANAANVRSRVNAVGTNTFFSDNNGWAAPIGPSDPAGANATGNPNRTMSVYALYTPTSGEVPYAEVPIVYDDQNVVNEYIVKNIYNDSTTVFADATSQAHYFRRSETIEQIWAGNKFSLPTDQQVFEPIPRLEGLRVAPSADPLNLWRRTLTLDVSSRVDVRRRPLGGSDIFSLYSQFIEAVQHDGGPTDWRVTFITSPVRT